MHSTRLSLRLTLLALAVMAACFTGCGDSDNFVFTNNNQGSVGNTGNLVFRFQQASAQTIDILPNGTVTVRFDLFGTNPPSQASLLDSEIRPYADLIVLEDVSADVVFVSVTCFDANDLPLAILTGTVDVIVGADNEVDLNDSQPVSLDAITVNPDPAFLATYDPTQLTITGSFGNGQTLPLPITANTVQFSGLGNVANVTANGLLSVGIFPLCGANTTATATFMFGATQVSDDFSVQTFCFDVFSPVNTNRETVEPFLVTPDFTYDEGYTFGMVAPNGEIIVDGGQLPGPPTYAVTPAVAGVTINSSTGELSIGAGVPVGTTFEVVITYVDDDRVGGTGATIITRFPVEVASGLPG